MTYLESRPAETGQENREEPRVLDPRETVQAGGVEKPTKPGNQRTRRVLLVDASPALQPALERCKTEHGRVAVVYANSLAKARELVKTAGVIDLAIVSKTLSDGSGIDLAHELKAKDKATASVLLADTPDFALAQQAMQMGALDLIVRPQAGAQQDTHAAWLAAAADRVGNALNRQWAERMRSARIRKLRRLCKRLNTARLEVTEQVDMLCNDLVTAYQELAVQMQNITQTRGYQDAIGEELDLEVVLRKTLEYIIQQAGPCNAAVFLPSSADEFSLGGYVNYDCTKESADMLLEHLADVLAPAVARHGDMIEATDNQQLDALLGDDWNYLADCHMLALPACSEGEPLAVITLFRDSEEPFTELAVEALAMVADQMGELLGRIIRVHHRAMPGFDEAAETDYAVDNDTYLPPSEWEGYDKQADPFDDEDDETLPF